MILLLLQILNQVGISKSSIIVQNYYGGYLGIHIRTCAYYTYIHVCPLPPVGDTSNATAIAVGVAVPVIILALIVVVVVVVILFIFLSRNRGE